VDAIDLVQGTTSSSIADMQTQYDGIEYEISEVNTGDGIEFDMYFHRVVRFTKLGFSFYYLGGAGHHIKLLVLNPITGQWEIYNTTYTSLALNYRYIDVKDAEEHIDNNGTVRAKFLHFGGAVAAHDLVIDYVALIR